MNSVSTFILAAVTVLTVSPPETMTGKVVAITDGDTITILVDKTQYKIRLEGIDAPEKKQAYGAKSKDALSDRIFGKEVRVEWKSRDRYQRILGQVYLDDRWINQEMVTDGWAWHFVKYNTDAKLSEAEKSARSAKRGLWADENPTPPWEFRKNKSKLKG